MQLIPGFKADTINDQVFSCISDQATLITDDSTSYVEFESIVKQHQAQVIPKNKIGDIRAWVHTAISNAKRMLLDIHHRINPEFLQSYLNKFCYKFNRRYFGEALLTGFSLYAPLQKMILGIECDNHIIF